MAQTRAEIAARKHAYYLANRVRILARVRVYGFSARARPGAREARAQYDAQHIERKRLYDVAYRARTREKKLAHDKAYYQARRAAIIARQKVYAARHPDVAKASRDRFREKKAAYDLQQRIRLTDAYVTKIFAARVGEIAPDVLDAKREIVRVKRLIGLPRMESTPHG